MGVFLKIFILLIIGLSMNKKKGNQNLTEKNKKVLKIPPKKPVASYNKKKRNEMDVEHIEFYTDWILSKNKRNRMCGRFYVLKE